MAKSNDVNVYLLNVEPPAGRPVFYAEASENDGETPPRRGGLRGWAEGVYHKVKAGWMHSPGLIARLGRQSWELVRERMHPDEMLLTQLRSARSIAVHYPASTDCEEVSAVWSRFLAVARRRHWAWLFGNALVCPLTVFLIPLPGPNLVGYWFVYRAVHHWLILSGLARVRRGVVAPRFRPRDDLASFALPGHLDPAEVVGFLKRHGAPPHCRARYRERSVVNSGGL